jgi:hypothetical protein
VFVYVTTLIHLPAYTVSTSSSEPSRVDQEDGEVFATPSNTSNAFYISNQKKWRSAHPIPSSRNAEKAAQDHTPSKLSICLACGTEKYRNCFIVSHPILTPYILPITREEALTAGYNNSPHSSQQAPRQTPPPPPDSNVT